MKKFLSIVLMILLVLSPVINVDAATTKATTSTSTKKTTTKKTTTKKTTTKKKSTEKTTEKETNKEEKKIKIHVFYSSYCGYCQALHEFLSELSKDETYGKMFEVVDYEVNTDEDNAELKTEVDAYFDNPTNEGVPVYVIGNEYFDGYGESYNDRIKKAIKDAYESGKTFNAVEKLAEKLGKDNSVIGYIILGAVAVIIIAVIVSSSKNRYYEDEENTEIEVKDGKEAKDTEVSTKSATKESTLAKTKTSTTTKKKTTNSTKKSKK